MHQRTPILEVSNLGKVYNGTWAVKGLNLSVRTGEIYGFLGRNGAGKTTTIRMIMGLIRPSQGQIRLFGRPKESFGQDMFRRIGSMIEYPGFYTHLTARENLLYNARMIGLPNLKAVDEILSFMGLGQAADKQVNQFSLGMKQRLGIARALLHEPELLILDEPTNGLDPAGIREIRHIIRDLSKYRNITIFVSSHILPEIEQLADRVGIIHQGQLVEEIAMDELERKGKQYLTVKSSNPYRAVQILEEKLRIQQLRLLDDGEIQVFEQLEQPHAMNRVLVEAGVDVFHLSVQKETLEDRFMRLTGGETR
ncbi:ATP-binding cassette domain-containing protein [Heliobacterium undosum]|uniref:ATP-binding cassette domain-containing protein n=1 Tax=Heliomicrobium undosum TaxID=121734 RepID=A0A845L486_9FIRM|nr:ABC transporter ATP-binding protein [Heliomicrobium undosum]MZP29989.1 ATP-binding cassette domain-containing protein [Heliomicrobium undosum]